MPVVPEETEQELNDDMDQFINWENADPAVGAGAGFGLDLPLTAPQPLDQDPNLDLMLENVSGDDFSFWALEHFASGNLPATSAAAIDNLLVTADMSCNGMGDTIPTELYDPEVPCYGCQRNGYECKTIREGDCTSCCTSCVALRVGCSFGLGHNHGVDEHHPLSSTRWPVLSDHMELNDNSPPVDLTTSEMVHSISAPDLAGLAGTASAADLSHSRNSSSNDLTSAAMAPMGSSQGPAKIGARFSRESLRILKNWITSHSRHPYPTDEEKESLQRLTGLNKTQITNWLANYRRRNNGKSKQDRSSSPHVSNMAMGAIDIPQRRGTPSPLDRRNLENMNPLQRWANSPPENEPATILDIARAVSASSGMSSGLSSPFRVSYTDDGSGRSLGHGSSASSLGTSHSSGGSFASAFSHGSRNSFGANSSMGSFGRGRRRRRRRAAPSARKPDAITANTLTQPLKTFQCTFCTETFRTKHDWQRHEKSLHLSLERWLCAPKGPRAFNPTSGHVECVFCGEPGPDEAHFETHNYMACQERSVDERTFYRKDHLRQHLKLVHNTKFVDWAMGSWQETTPEIRSRCGFCGIVMDSWSFRVDHLAEHFKTGNTMADWKGDWGFEPPVLEMVQNSIPPYLIHNERGTPLPFVANVPSPATPVHAYDLLKSELVFYAENFKDRNGGVDPTDDDLQVEACRIVFGSEIFSKKTNRSGPSWLRDLVMSSDDLTLKASMAPIRGIYDSDFDSRLSQLRINGKDNIFEDCPLERQLHEYVTARLMLGLTAMDAELQVRACNILAGVEEASSSPSEMVANFMLRLIAREPRWLASFRQRAHLPRTEDILDEKSRPKDQTKIDSTIHNYSRLEADLGDYARSQRAVGIEPDDADLQRKARIIIYEYDDGWNQTAADNAEWLAAFRARLASKSPQSHGPLTFESLKQQNEQERKLQRLQLQQQEQIQQQAYMAVPCSMAQPLGSGVVAPAPAAAHPTAPRALKASPFFMHDMNCYRRLERELGRFTASTMSANNPNRHVPSDSELQHQARWILYDDDDPWNQTAADNAEWLQRFKRDYGIISKDEPGMPGLPAGNAWSVQQGGTGFAPPYAFSKNTMTLTPPPEGGAAATTAAAGGGAGDVQILIRDGARMFNADRATADKYLRTLTERYPAPATVFCSRELESGLSDYVREEVATGQFPSDDSLRSRAREILRTESTAADDPVLLEKFKAMVRGEGSEEEQRRPTDGAAGGGVELDLAHITDTQLDEMLLDLAFEGLDGDDGGGGGAPLTGSPSQLFG